MPQPGYLTARQAADILGTDPKTVGRWAKEGKLPHIRTLGNHRRYKESDIRKIAESMRQDATSGPLAP